MKELNYSGGKIWNRTTGIRLKQLLYRIAYSSGKVWVRARLNKTDNRDSREATGESYLVKCTVLMTLIRDIAYPPVSLAVSL
jgi:hypothetical protein